MRFAVSVSRLFLLSLLFMFSAHATTLRDIRVLFDGVTDPAGDGIEVEVAFGKDETELFLEVRAFTVSGRNDEILTRIKSPDKDVNKPYRDEDGHFLSKLTLKRPKGDNPFATAIVPVPYQSLDLKVVDGETAYLIGYEVMAYREVGGKQVVDFVAPSELTEVVVNNRVRTELETPPKAGKIEFRSVPVTGRVIKFNPDTLETKVDVKEGLVKIKRPLYSQGAPPEIKKTEIPNSFKRDHVADSFERAASDESLKLDPSRRTVHFATNRRVIKNTRTADRFGDVDAKLSYGEATVYIPIRFHKRGTLEVTNWWRFNEKDPKAFRIDGMMRDLTAQQLYSKLTENDVFVFIHGFNNKFAEALLVAAQIAYDIQFPGKTFAFAWPSQGKETGYAADEKQCEASRDDLAIVLRDLANQVRRARARGKQMKVHLVAHSMGNRLLMTTLRDMHLYDRKQKSEKILDHEPAIEKLFSSIVLAAPDMKTSQFDAMVPSTIAAAETVNFYYSALDVPLGLSEVNSSRDRAGNFPAFAEGMHTINADNVNSRLVGAGHSYVRSANEVLDDISLLFNLGFPPDKRQPPLAPKEELKEYPGYDHYYFLQKG